MTCKLQYIRKIAIKNGFGSKKNSNRSKKVVTKRLGKAFWTEKCATATLYPRGRGSRKGGRGDG